MPLSIPVAWTDAHRRHDPEWRLGVLGLPTVLVQEGGYDLTAIGALVRAVLEGFRRERAPG